jgi:predicted MPP superfamily phosphohydrolase
MARDASELRQAPRRHSLLRRAAVRAVEGVAMALGGRAFYRRAHLSRPGLRLRRERIAHPELPRALEGFTLVQLSDLHAGPFLRSGDLDAVVREVEALRPDVVALTGDHITHAAEEALAITADVGRLRARLGVFGVLGNHDYKGRREGEIVAAWERVGVEFLRDRNRRFAVEGGALVLVGVEDLEESKRLDVDAARAGVGPEDFEIVLCHHPLGAPVFARERCLAVLSGHTHGGQIDLPLLRRAGPAHPGARVRMGSTTLLVSRGLGSIGVPLRVRAPTEIVVVELARAAA